MSWVRKVTERKTERDGETERHVDTEKGEGHAACTVRCKRGR
jgi:hypothetical protein